MRSHIGWRGERSIPYKGVETSHQQTCFNTVKLTTIHNEPKRTVSTSGGFELLQDIGFLLELDLEMQTQKAKIFWFDFLTHN